MFTPKISPRYNINITSMTCTSIILLSLFPFEIKITHIIEIRYMILKMCNIRVKISIHVFKQDGCFKKKFELN